MRTNFHNILYIVQCIVYCRAATNVNVLDFLANHDFKKKTKKNNDQS